MDSKMLEKLLPLLFLFAFAVNASDGEDGPSNSTTPVPAPAPPPNNGINNEGGAAGGAGNEYSLSRGGLIAIIVVVVVVAVFGIASSVLFYIAKKRQWEVRKTIKRASRKVASKVDVRRSMDARRSRTQSSRPKGAVRMQSPPTSAKPKDLEKGQEQRVTHRMEVEEPKTNKDADKRWKAIMPESWTIGGRR